MSEQPTPRTDQELANWDKSPPLKSVIALARQLERELAEAHERHTMQLAAISTQAMSNTDSSVDEPLSCHEDFKTCALHDVNTAIHREMERRKECDQWREVAERFNQENEDFREGYPCPAVRAFRKLKEARK